MAVHVIIFSADQVLERGLRLAGMDPARQSRMKRDSLIEFFKDSYGVAPIVYATIWEDIQTTTVPYARIDTTQRSCTIETFLQAINFLKKYDTELGRSIGTGRSVRFCRDWGWYFLEKIALMRQVKIVWPADGDWKTIFLASVDGVQCRFHEMKHLHLSKDPGLFAHKFNGPGLGYELALSLFEDKLVWLKGPYRPGEFNDRSMFESELRGKIPAGKKVVADGGYRKKGGDPKVSTTNAHDSRELRKFKARAKSRQENFHSRIKRFEAVNCGVFNHGIDEHQICFEAICVICQYEMDLGFPMFTV